MVGGLARKMSSTNIKTWLKRSDYSNKPMDKRGYEKLGITNWKYVAQDRTNNRVSIS